MTHFGSLQEIYEIIEQIGDGSFGTVHKAKNKNNGKLFAIKIMKKKYESLEECEGQFEPKLLSLLPPHVNIIQMYDSFLSPTTCDLSFVMEYSDGGNLYQLMRDRKQNNLPFSHCELRNILHQILSAVSHIHHHHIFHRDMKPENLLLNYSTGKPIIKLADFGLAREFLSSPPYTEYVSTRWYRAPEILLRSTEYSASVDLWAIGTIFAELINLEPLFPGESEIDQIYRICSVLGSPGNKTGIVGQKNNRTSMRYDKRISPGFARKKTKDLNDHDLHSLHINTSTASTISSLDGGGEWKEGVKLAHKMGFKFPNLLPKPLKSVIPNASESMLDLIQHFLFFNPQQRWSADFALRHKFFSETEEPVHTVIPIDAMIEPITPPEQQQTEIMINNTEPSPMSIITPLDLLPTPLLPYQMCPEWNNNSMCDSSHSGRSITSSYTTHIDTFLHGTTHCDHSNAWFSQSRPIYSSHQKAYPVPDHRPSSSHNNNTIVSSSYYSENGIEGKNHKRPSLLGHRLSSHHLDRIPHYGTQLIKWSPPYYFQTFDHHQQPSESRRQCRTLLSIKQKQSSLIHLAESPFLPDPTSTFPKKSYSLTMTVPSPTVVDKPLITYSSSPQLWPHPMQRKMNSITPPQRLTSCILDTNKEDTIHEDEYCESKPTVFFPLPLQ
ncbi:kinase-like domain-containing protein [Cokeromyces recurvatus]|uniref:kinase-like domain-containing protein n=1 Tax=Cokeromyces recurvatus TaxID=90255 RepID=UPI00221E9519|nr:kinase-like domain-containing protein [Cokeromyces recurvatus]KAI7900432.1 kinase-like domain-containing protein [Cokeromyces recurvatus]